MEQERNLLHVLVEHPIILFGVGALIILGLLLMILYFLAKRSQRKGGSENKR